MGILLTGFAVVSFLATQEYYIFTPLSVTQKQFIKHMNDCFASGGVYELKTTRTIHMETCDGEPVRNFTSE